MEKVNPCGSCDNEYLGRCFCEAFSGQDTYSIKVKCPYYVDANIARKQRREDAKERKRVSKIKNEIIYRALEYLSEADLSNFNDEQVNILNDLVKEYKEKNDDVS